ncbi:tRNA (guanosine(37)-N1)-methyltransferase TrmD [Mycoplasma nasistruthionis]|uniref:tRNA (guanine-N(1)-)-methyltransferase n=1 Tax=Mycoplasma nasistruthionis TaxID=353852 RepID=A0A4Y6I6T1_9MOLU|nr:tRNA (guanosine(37)-N1)-methyltransferase TrmD [Mycoplasma nasistruthionis]QCZ36960.1 tRNA (guanosine(37)-N1)-methyltransferase TrmD [Mycoplasma nasistruthionis]QDF65233.1 tRNA (guanosine(37)-N1)-methyltransferase TrmD [Mycoplasma nasistruthionis]
MKINFLTLFPNYFEPFINESIIKKAQDKDLVSFEVVDFRDFSRNKHRKVDDEIYGGGHGLLLQVEPIDLALNSLKDRGGVVVVVSPQGKQFTQQIASDLAKHSQITFISGRYEGFDERVIQMADYELSIGDFVLTGGELPSMVMADAIVRLLPGVIKTESHTYESFQGELGLLEHPQYSRPRSYTSVSDPSKTYDVPEVLFSGDHKKIQEWKDQAAWQKTAKNRPDIIERIKNEK